jgi:hypothetical protein
VLLIKMYLSLLLRLIHGYLNSLWVDIEHTHAKIQNTSTAVSIGPYIYINITF